MGNCKTACQDTWLTKNVDTYRNDLATDAKYVNSTTAAFTST